jgi:hypothetical protein
LDTFLYDTNDINISLYNILNFNTIKTYFKSYIFFCTNGTILNITFKFSTELNMQFIRILNNINITHESYAKNFNFINIDSKKIKFILLDLSYQDDSNKPKMIKIQSLDCLKIEVYRIRKFENTSKISKFLRIFI